MGNYYQSNQSQHQKNERIHTIQGPHFVAQLMFNGGRPIIIINMFNLWQCFTYWNMAHPWLISITYEVIVWILEVWPCPKEALDKFQLVGKLQQPYTMWLWTEWNWLWRKPNLFQLDVMESQLWTTSLGYMCMHTLLKTRKGCQFLWTLEGLWMEPHPITSLLWLFILL